MDLAGSERAKKTGAVGTRLKESVGINQVMLFMPCHFIVLRERMTSVDYALLFEGFAVTGESYPCVDVHSGGDPRAVQGVEADPLSAGLAGRQQSHCDARLHIRRRVEHPRNAQHVAVCIQVCRSFLLEVSTSMLKEYTITYELAGPNPSRIK